MKHFSVFTVWIRAINLHYLTCNLNSSESVKPYLQGQQPTACFTICFIHAVISISAPDQTTFTTNKFLLQNGTSCFHHSEWQHTTNTPFTAITFASNGSKLDRHFFKYFRCRVREKFNNSVWTLKSVQFTIQVLAYITISIVSDLQPVTVFLLLYLFLTWCTCDISSCDVNLQTSLDFVDLLSIR